jgi:hypothetical protein
MSDQKQVGEKDEKDEKDSGEDWGSEKWGGEKWSRDPLGSALWAFFIIWIGIVLLLANLGEEGDIVEWGNVWAWILIGGGALTWLDILLRTMMPAYRRPLGGRIVWGTILLVFGIGALTDLSLWPLILIVIGVAMLFNFFRSQQE